MGTLTHLDPGNVWKHFEALCGIPHPSGHEEGVAQYVAGFAASRGCAVKRDAVGNVIVTQPATPGHEAAATLVLQAHLDMVGVAADDVEHDFEVDPIVPWIDGDLVRARGTTLGADNGIGCAFMLALMEEEGAPHPRLEHLFTLNEEDGMDGAHGLRGETLEGRRLINLDTEEYGQIFVSCAGGGDSVLRLPVERSAANPGAATLRVTVGGLAGGHSGLDIGLNRGSGNKLVGRLLAAALEVSPIRLCTLRGGKKRNAIADGAEAVFDVPRADVDAVRAALAACAELLGAELALVDPGFALTVKDQRATALWPMTPASTRRAVDLVLALPHGVLAMSQDVAGLVETSTNLGIVATHDDGTLECALLSRSAVTSAVDMLKERIRAIAHLAGATVDEPLGYPGWAPNPHSELLVTAKQVFAELHGREPAVMAVHAGLETGLFAEKLGGADMISVGPDMADVHSPDEHLVIPSVAQFWTYLKALLAALS